MVELVMLVDLVVVLMEMVVHRNQQHNQHNQENLELMDMETLAVVLGADPPVAVDHIGVAVAVVPVELEHLAHLMALEEQENHTPILVRGVQHQLEQYQKVVKQVLDLG
jgi:hypothetical protein